MPCIKGKELRIPGVILCSLLVSASIGAEQPEKIIPPDTSDICAINFFNLPIRLYSKKFLWENDTGFSDEDYTNGMKWERNLYSECDLFRSGASGVKTSIAGRGLDTAQKFLDQYPASDANQTLVANFGYAFGMNLYTPTDLEDPNHIAEDRPYSGWAYVSVLQNRVFTPGGAAAGAPPVEKSKFEFMIGLLGEYAEQDRIQKGFHEFGDSIRPLGWDNQQEGGFGINVVYDRSWYKYLSDGNVRFEYGYGGSLGNVRTELRARIGYVYSSNIKSWNFLDGNIISPSLITAREFRKSSPDLAAAVVGDEKPDDKNIIDYDSRKKCL